MLKTKIIFASMTVFLVGALANATCAETSISANARKLDLAGNILITTVSGKGTSQKTDTEQSYMKLADKKVQNIFLQILNEGNKGELLSQVFVSDDGAFAIIRDFKTCKMSVLGTDGEDTEVSRLAELSERSVTIKRSNPNQLITINKIEN